MCKELKCPNCDSIVIIEQVTARGIFTRQLNAGEEGVPIMVVSWEPKHDFYECFDCSQRWEGL